MWQRQIAKLVDLGYRCIVPDLRGHGESHEPGEVCDLKEHIGDIIETLEPQQIRYPAIWAGHSLGAIIAIELAQLRADMFSKILAVSMPAKVPALTAEAFKWFVGGPHQAIKESGLHRNLDFRTRELISTNNHSLHQIATHFAQLNYLNRVPKILCPVHFAVGRLDPVAPCSEMQRLHKAMKGSTLTIIEWAGHNPMDSQAAAFDRWFFEKLVH
jgi:pimeloyl-ACP methyl ester carboxylesterase